MTLSGPASVRLAVPVVSLESKLNLYSALFGGQFLSACILSSSLLT